MEKQLCLWELYLCVSGQAERFWQRVSAELYLDMEGKLWDRTGPDMKTRTKASAPFGGSAEEWAEPLCALHRHTYSTMCFNVIQSQKSYSQALWKQIRVTTVSYRPVTSVLRSADNSQFSSPEDIQWGQLEIIQETNASQKTTLILLYKLKPR